MHLNYHYFKLLCPALENKLHGRIMVNCFSQNKEELIMEFSDPASPSYFIRALLLPSNTGISFPENFKRSKKNSVDLFTELIGKKVDSVKLLAFERAFYLQFDSGQALLFKMHGSRSNILFFQNPSKYPETVFRKELSDDLKILISELENPLDLSERRFIELEGNASKFLPTLGKLPRAWLKEKGYLNADLSEKYQLIKSVLDLVESPLFSIIKDAGKYFLTLLPVETSLESTHDPLHAANLFYRHAVVTSAFEGLKTKTLKALSGQKQKTENYIEKTREKLDAMEKETPPSQVADLIMANLHQIPKGVENVVLFDFYRNENREIELKRGITPQKQAEILYRKSKNRKIEVEQLRTNLAHKEKLLLEIELQYEEIQSLHDFKTLTKTIKSENMAAGQKENLPQPPFKKFEFEGFDILVGKSAKDNDELLRRYSYKDDLWLHAKDVSGSHVIIKQPTGLLLPKTVLERAAELAAYYSKNRTETYAPVIYTPCKYVRKVKGSAPGAVKVDRESVLMVTPKGPQSS